MADATETAAEKPETEVVATEDKPELTAEQNQERGDDGKFRKPVQPRIDELTRKHRESEREAAYWRQRAESREAQDSAKAAPEKPTPDKFENYGDFVEALTEWKADEKVNAKLKERDAESEKKQAADKRNSTWAERSAAARAKHSDFDSVIAASQVPVADHVIAVLEDSEIGPELAYHLDRHPEIAERLNKLGPLAAAREVGRIEDSLTAEKETPDPKPEEIPAKKTTTAPPPAKPLGSGRSTTVDLAKASMDDYVKQRKAQGARWAR